MKRRSLQRHDPVLDAQHSLAIFQAFDPTTFGATLEQWLDALPPHSLTAEGILPPPGEVLSRPGHGGHHIRIQQDSYLAISGTISMTLDTVRISIRAPQFLFLSVHQPFISVWLPISDWDNVRPWVVIEAFKHAARALLSPYDPTETLAGQMLCKIFVSPTLSSYACTYINDR